MGATYTAETGTGTTPDEALKTMLDKLTADYGGHERWPDPQAKPGWVQVWDTPVTDDAITWMRGWVQQNPPAALIEAATRQAQEFSARHGFKVEPDPFDKFGPWLMFPLAAGGWHFFGLVNT